MSDRSFDCDEEQTEQIKSIFALYGHAVHLGQELEARIAF